MEGNKCRACLLEKDMADLCDWYLTMEIGDALTYLECFEMCTQLDIKSTNAKSPYVRDMHYLCQDCIQKMIISYRFIRKAQKSAHELCFLPKNKENLSNMRRNTFEYVYIQEALPSDEYISIPQKDQQNKIGNFPEENPLLKVDTVSGLPNEICTQTYKKQDAKIHLAKGKKVSRREKEGKLEVENNQFPCDYCKKLFPANKLQQHKSRYHRPKIFLCDICRK
uniref:ZAD domain-containing protein n=1 Tax=Bactrocera latifrons TaxID=174628 RepID=A0A0K8U2D8_BACLA